MSTATQIAFQLDDDSLRRIDELAALRSSSRAEVLRTAVREMLSRQREATIDAQLAAGYGARPPDEESAAWAALSVEALQASGLDW